MWNISVVVCLTKFEAEFGQNVWKVCVVVFVTRLEVKFGQIVWKGTCSRFQGTFSEFCFPRYGRNENHDFGPPVWRGHFFSFPGLSQCYREIPTSGLEQCV